MHFSRRQLFLMIAVVCAAWVGLVLGLSRWQQSHSPARPSAGPEFPHFPGTESVAEQTSPNLGWRKYWFHLNEDYPSKSVLSFYQQEMDARGWLLVGNPQPRWHRRNGEEEAYDVLEATWVAPNRLFQLDLQMLSRVALVSQAGEVLSEDRARGIEVYVTLRRVLAPGLIVPQSAPAAPRSGIELPTK